MDPLLISAASGMKARLESLDMLANNLANTGTTAFKADKEFYGIYKDALPKIERQWTDFSQGALIPNGNPLNLSLNGKGFFTLNSPGGVIYTRNGEFQISKANQLQTAEGFTLRNTRDQGRPITIDPSQPIEIDRAGIVRQGGQERGQIETMDIAEASTSLRKQGNSYFAIDFPGIQAQPAAALEIYQGSLEQSNVPVGDGAVRLVNIMRQFEMMQKAMLLGSDMNRHAIEEVARPS